MNDTRRDKAAMIVRVVFLALCMVGVSFAWFNQKPYIGGSMEYQKKMQITSIGGNVTNYIGTVLGNSGSDITYTELTGGMQVIWKDGQSPDVQDVSGTGGLGGFTAENLYPGARIYFKTDVENTEEIPVDLSIYLTGVEYSKPLNTAIYFVEVQPAAFSHCYSADAVEVNPENGEPPYYRLSSARVTQNFRIPAAHTEGDKTIPGKQTIYWYIEINGNEAGNDCANAWLNINQMQLITGTSK